MPSMAQFQTLNTTLAKVAEGPGWGEDKGHGSGQIIATSHDLTPNGGFSTGNPLISGKPRLMKYYNLPRWVETIFPYNCQVFVHL